MSRRPSWAGQRTEFTNSVREAIAARSGGVCETDGCGAPASEFDHHVPDGLGGEATVDNGRHLCGPCHQEKSKDDIRRMISADRKGGRLGQRSRRERAIKRGTYKPMPSRPIAGSRNSGWKKPLRGKGERRT